MADDCFILFNFDLDLFVNDSLFIEFVIEICFRFLG